MSAPEARTKSTSSPSLAKLRKNARSDLIHDESLKRELEFEARILTETYLEAFLSLKLGLIAGAVEAFQIVQVVKNPSRAREILAAGVVVDGDESSDSRRETGAQTVFGVFQRDAVAADNPSFSNTQK